jgi:hypothetical protein
VNNPKVYLYNYDGFTQAKYFEQAVLAKAVLAKAGKNKKFSLLLDFFKFLI